MAEAIRSLAAKFVEIRRAAIARYQELLREQRELEAAFPEVKTERARQVAQAAHARKAKSAAPVKRRKRPTPISREGAAQRRQAMLAIFGLAPKPLLPAQLYKMPDVRKMYVTEHALTQELLKMRKDGQIVNVHRVGWSIAPSNMPQYQNTPNLAADTAAPTGFVEQYQ
jgi:hypothetical protein